MPFAFVTPITVLFQFIMLESYFFVPGDKKKYLDKMKDIAADYFVIDLEDAVSANNKTSALNEVLKLSISTKSFVRVPFLEDVYSEEEKQKVLSKFEGRVVIPKVKSVADIESVLALKSQNITLKLIILVENPQGYISIRDILQNYSQHIEAIGFGSHDFCSLMGMVHTLENLMHYKKELLVLAKAYDIKFLDTVDINMTDFSNFKEECITAFEIGADGKFLIHPRQLEELNTIEFLSDAEISEIKTVHHHIQSYDSDDIDILKIDGKIYEKPHILRIKRIMEKLKS